MLIHWVDQKQRICIGVLVMWVLETYETSLQFSQDYLSQY